LIWVPLTASVMPILGEPPERPSLDIVLHPSYNCLTMSKYTRSVTIRLTEDDYLRLTAEASRADRTLSEFIRKRLEDSRTYSVPETTREQFYESA
jgi:hypothetical protein